MKRDQIETRTLLPWHLHKEQALALSAMFAGATLVHGALALRWSWNETATMGRLFTLPEVVGATGLIILLVATAWIANWLLLRASGQPPTGRWLPLGDGSAVVPYDAAVVIELLMRPTKSRAVWCYAILCAAAYVLVKLAESHGAKRHSMHLALGASWLSPVVVFGVARLVGILRAYRDLPKTTRFACDPQRESLLLAVAGALLGAGGEVLVILCWPYVQWSHYACLAVCVLCLSFLVQLGCCVFLIRLRCRWTPLAQRHSGDRLET